MPRVKIFLKTAQDLYNLANVSEFLYQSRVGSAETQGQLRRFIDATVLSLSLSTPIGQNM